MIDERDRDTILCMDSDFDYLFKNFNDQSRLVTNTPRLFHTYAYATENFLCHPPSLHKVCVKATKNDTLIFNFEKFMTAYSRTIYPLFLWYAYSRPPQKAKRPFRCSTSAAASGSTTRFARRRRRNAALARPSGRKASPNVGSQPSDLDRRSGRFRAPYPAVRRRNRQCLFFHAGPYAAGQRGADPSAHRLRTAAGHDRRTDHFGNQAGRVLEKRI